VRRKERKGDEKPAGLPEAVSSTRERTPVPVESEPESESDEERSSPAPKKPMGLPMTPSLRARLQLVLDSEEGSIPPEALPSEAPAVEASKPPSGLIPFETAELRVMRSLSRWIAVSGLLTLTVGALTGLSYATGTGSVAHVVVGILSSAFALWLLAAAFAFYRSTRAAKGRDARHHLVSGFSLLRTALLLKTILLFSAMALGCFTFSVAASILFLL
jgi:hypothetical protein